MIVRLPFALSDRADIWVRDLERGTSIRLTFDAREGSARPLWSPDGAQIVFSSGRGHSDLSADLYRRAANGSGADELLYRSEAGNQLLAFGWSADGRDLFFSSYPLAEATAPPLWRLPLSGQRVAAPVMESRARIINASLSPDGRWLAYATDESGVFEIFVQPYPNLSQGKWQISARGGTEPRWRSDGKELFFIAPGGTLTAVAVDADPSAGTLSLGTPVQLFRAPLAGSPNREVGHYAADADGQRFLIRVDVESTSAGNAADSPVHVIVNWQSSISRN